MPALQVGWVRFGSVKVYRSQAEWELDASKHCVASDSPYAWKPGTMPHKTPAEFCAKLHFHCPISQLACMQAACKRHSRVHAGHKLVVRISGPVRCLLPWWLRILYCPIALPAAVSRAWHCSCESADRPWQQIKPALAMILP